jgi:hypothetical protein
MHFTSNYLAIAPLLLEHFPAGQTIRTIFISRMGAELTYTMFECAAMEELSLPDLIAAHLLMQLSGRGAQGEELSNMSLKNIIKLVCDDTLEENEVNSSSKRKAEDSECELPFTNAMKRKRYRSLDSIYKETTPVRDVCNADAPLIIGVKKEHNNCMKKNCYLVHEYSTYFTTT